MPFAPDRIVGHDRERLAFAFLMPNGNEPIERRISEAAMDALAGERGRQTTARQVRFLAHRDDLANRIGSVRRQPERDGICHSDIHQARSKARRDQQ